MQDRTMQDRQDTIPISAGKQNLKNRLPGAVAFVETFDTDDDTEPANILSLDSLRKAFATVHSAETELAETIPEIEPSAKRKPEVPERPNYEIDDDIDSEEEDRQSFPSAEPSVSVGVRLETIIEAMLFVGNRENRPLDADRIIEKLRNVSAEEVEQAVALLNGQYQERNCPYTIVSVGGGYRMELRSEFESVRSNLHGKVRGTRLSQQAIDTLAVVAYRQPITAEEIQNVRQQSCSSILNKLVHRNLLRISREVQDKKSIVRYHTTSRFLELFQIKSLDDIPKIDEWDYR